MKRPLVLLLALLGCTHNDVRDAASDSAAPVVPPDSVSSSSHSDLIRVAQPLRDAIIASPVTITGQARGNWYFEASFPVILIDAAGDTLAVQPAHAQGEWMTENFVPFTVTLDFTTPAPLAGTLILKKDNPSGLPEHDDELRIPVRFH